MSDVKLILREDVAKLGDAGDVVMVKPGYARNFLLRKGVAALASEAKIRELEHQRRVIEAKLAREMKDLQGLRDRIQALRLDVVAQAGDEGKLFGSVTAQQIADLLAEKGVVIDRRKISLEEPIKELGEHQVSVKLRGTVSAKLVVEVRRAE